MTEQHFGHHKITNCRSFVVKDCHCFGSYEELFKWRRRQEYDQAFDAARQRTIVALARVDVDLGDPKTEPPSDKHC